MHCLIYSKEKARESSFFLVMSYELCLACQHFILIWANHKLHKKLANQNGNICPCDQITDVL